MALQTSTAWWKGDKQKNLSQRIAEIQEINDPTTNSDEILKGSKILLFILLCFTGLLGGLSYYKNFSGAFTPEVAAFMAVSLTVVIEWGKNYASKWALRIPFFRGFGHLATRPENTFVWVGLVAIAACTFYMSVYNSTKGGEQLSKMLHSERNSTTFKANTADIDAQINVVQNGIQQNQGIKWKGTTTYTAQKAIVSQSKSLEKLQDQRAAAIAQQRADYERTRNEQAENSNFASSLVMASGGYVELLQFLLLLLIVSCEKSLDRSPTPSTDGQKPAGIGFRRQEQYATAQHQDEQQPRNPIGYKRYPEQKPPVPITGLPHKNTVEQWPTAEQSEQPTRNTLPGTVTATSVVADVKNWEKRAKQCFERAFTQEREEHRQNNRRRCECFAGMLSSIGVVVRLDWEKEILEFEHPSIYDTSSGAIQKVILNQEQLKEIGK